MSDARGDALIPVIKSALGDMSMHELADLEDAINAEIQDRYHAAHQEYLEDTEQGEPDEDFSFED